MRLIILKTLSRSLGFCCLLMAGVSCESPNVAVENPGPDASVIEGRIMNWNFADSMTIRASALLSPSYDWDVFASSRISSNGSFLLSLPDPPLAARSRWGYTHDAVSDTSARFVFLWLLEVSGPSRANLHWAYNSNIAYGQYHTPGYFDSFPVYADRPTWVRGTDTLVLSPGGGSPSDTLLIVREDQFVRGWNRIVRRNADLRAHVMMETWRIESTRTPCWYLQP